MQFHHLTAILFACSLMSAATVNSTANCGGTSTTSNGAFVLCSGSVDYAMAYGSATNSGSDIIVSTSAYSSFAYARSISQTAQANTSAETTISDTLGSVGTARAGYAEIVFDSLSINQNVLVSTNASLDILLNGDSIYSCDLVDAVGWSACSTASVMAPVELGMPFVLTVTNTSSSPVPSFAGGISSQFEVSLLEANHALFSNPSALAAVPEPGVFGLLAAGFSVFAFSNRRK